MSDAIVSEMVGGLAKISSAIISQKMTIDENKAARKEAFDLAMIQRGDELNQLEILNEFSNKELKLNEDKLSFEKNTAEQQAGEVTKMDKYNLNKTNYSDLTSSVGSMKPSDESWLYKSRILNRF